MASLTFLGAARTVTGSKYLLEVDRQRVLVDCGQFQGLKELRQRNWAAFPVHPSSLATRHPHARTHRSFGPAAAAGREWLSRADLLHGRHGRSVLAGAARRRPAAGRRRAVGEPPPFLASSHRRCRSSPRRTRIRVLGQLRDGPVRYPRRGRRRYPCRVYARRPPARVGVRARQSRRQAGRASCLAATLAATTARCCPIRRRRRTPRRCCSNPPTAIAFIRTRTMRAMLERVVRRDARRAAGGSSFPPFAVGRAEEVLYWLKQLEDGRPHSRRCRSISTARWPSKRSTSTPARDRARPRRAARDGGDAAPSALARFHAGFLIARLAEIVQSSGPAIVISASGMATGGRVLHHLAAVSARPAAYDSLRRLSGRRHARAGARRRREGSQDSWRDGSGERENRNGSTACRRTPTRQKSCGGSARFRRRRGRPTSCTANRSRRPR